MLGIPDITRTIFQDHQDYLVISPGLSPGITRTIFQDHHDYLSGSPRLSSRITMAQVSIANIPMCARPTKNHYKTPPVRPYPIVPQQYIPIPYKRKHSKRKISISCHCSKGLYTTTNI